jgi:Gnt-I system high-affinity gluconate transporter
LLYRKKIKKSGRTIAAILRVTFGSAMIAGLTASELVAPLVTGKQIATEIMVLTVGAGSILVLIVTNRDFGCSKSFSNSPYARLFYRGI